MEEGAGCLSTEAGGGAVVSKTFHPFNKTKKIISPISFAEINDKLSIP